MTSSPNKLSQKVWICPKSDQLAQEAHEDFAERDQQNSQDMNAPQFLLMLKLSNVHQNPHQFHRGIQEHLWSFMLAVPRRL